MFVQPFVSFMAAFLIAGGLFRIISGVIYNPRFYNHTTPFKLFSSPQLPFFTVVAIFAFPFAHPIQQTSEFQSL